MGKRHFVHSSTVTLCGLQSNNLRSTECINAKEGDGSEAENNQKSLINDNSWIWIHNLISPLPRFASSKKFGEPVNCLMRDRICTIIARSKPDWLSGCVIISYPSFLLPWHRTSHSEGWLGCGSAQPHTRYALLSWHHAITVILQGYRAWPEYQTAQQERPSKIYLPLVLIDTVVDREVWDAVVSPTGGSVGRVPRALFDLRIGSRAGHKGRFNHRGANCAA